MCNLIIKPTLSPQTKRPINLILYKYRCKTKPFTGIYQNQYFSYFFFIMTTTKDCTWSRTVQQPSCQRQRSELDQILEVAGEGREKEGSTAHPISAEPCLQADCQLELRKELKKANDTFIKQHVYMWATDSLKAGALFLPPSTLRHQHVLLCVHEHAQPRFLKTSCAREKILPKELLKKIWRSRVVPRAY